MAQLDSQMHWVITENIARFQEKLKSETDTCQRKCWKVLLVLEREKLRAMLAPPVPIIRRSAGKAPEHDQAEKEQGGGAPQETLNAVRTGCLACCRALTMSGLRPHLKPVVLKYRQSLYQAHKPIGFVYFIETGVGSLVNTMANGDAAEVGTIGNEGIVGLPLVLEDERSPTSVYIQVPGAGLRMKASLFKREMARSASLRTVMHRYTHAFFNQVAQSAACNQFHSLEQRCSRWLLMTHDRMGSDSFLLTQEFLAMMLGVQRTGVTAAAAGALQRAGIISYKRGNVDDLGSSRIGAPFLRMLWNFQSWNLTVCLVPGRCAAHIPGEYEANSSGWDAVSVGNVGAADIVDSRSKLHLRRR